MSIPLDRLYDFLYNTCNRDIVIYRWMPHGSKNLNDLTHAANQKYLAHWPDLLVTPAAIMHDQEPLQFDLWSDQDYYTRWLNLVEKNNWDKQRALSDECVEYVQSLGLRGILAPASNFYEHVLLFHSERNSKQVEIYRNHNYEPVYYWSHALIAQDWFRYADLDPKLNFDVDQFSYDFLIYNRAWAGSREYRLKFTSLLIDLNLENYCQTSFSAIDQGQHYTAHQFKNTNLSISRKDIENYFPANTHQSSASADYNNEDYSNTAIEVVLETLFDDSRHHLTEKALRPIAVGKPFILVSTPNSLKYLRSYGFKTFDGIIDESYDEIDDPVLRITRIAQEMKRLSSLPPEYKKKIWEQLHKIAAYNKKRFFSEEFTNYIIQELKQNLDNALLVVKQNLTGRPWLESKTVPITWSKERLDYAYPVLVKYLGEDQVQQIMKLI